MYTKQHNVSYSRHRLYVHSLSCTAYAILFPWLCRSVVLPTRPLLYTIYISLSVSVWHVYLHQSTRKKQTTENRKKISSVKTYGFFLPSVYFTELILYTYPYHLPQFPQQEVIINSDNYVLKTSVNWLSRGLLKIQRSYQDLTIHNRMLCLVSPQTIPRPSRFDHFQ